MQLVKLGNKACIVRIDNLEVVHAVNGGIKLINSDGHIYEVHYGTTGDNVGDRDADFDQLLKLLVKE